MIPNIWIVEVDLLETRITGRNTTTATAAGVSWYMYFFSVREDLICIRDIMHREMGTRNEFGYRLPSGCISDMRLRDAVSKVLSLICLTVIVRCS